MALKKVIRTDNTDSFKFEKKGQTLKGYYLKTVVKPINGKDCNVHLFQTSKGLVSVLGQHDLSQQLAEITLGCYIEATFTGVKNLKGGKTMKLYDVGWDDSDTIDVDSVDTEAGTEEPAEEEEQDSSDDVADDEPAEDEEEETPMDEVKTAPARSIAAKPGNTNASSKVNALLNKNRKAS